MDPTPTVPTGRYPTYDDRGRFSGTLEVLGVESRYVPGQGPAYFYRTRWLGQRHIGEWEGRYLQWRMTSRRLA